LQTKTRFCGEIEFAEELRRFLDVVRWGRATTDPRSPFQNVPWLPYATR
jgi:hypothetical protein